MEEQIEKLRAELRRNRVALTAFTDAGGGVTLELVRGDILATDWRRMTVASPVNLTLEPAVALFLSLAVAYRASRWGHQAMEWRARAGFGLGSHFQRRLPRCYAEWVALERRHAGELAKRYRWFFGARAAAKLMCLTRGVQPPGPRPMGAMPRYVKVQSGRT
jgi:hypothetical protein